MKLLCKTICTIIAFSVFLLQPLAVPAQNDSDAMQYLRDVCVVNAKVHNLGLTETITLLSPFAKGTVTVDGEMVMIPVLQMKGTIHTDYTDLTGKTVYSDMPFYMDQTTDRMIYYYCSAGQWRKITQPVNAAYLQTLTGQAAVEQSMQMVKAVKIIKDTDDIRALQVTVDGKKMADYVRKYGNPANIVKMTAANANVLQQTQLFNAILDSMGDLDYTMTVDKQTKRMRAVDCDLTSFGRRIANAVLAQHASTIKPAQKEVLQCLIQSTSIKINAVCRPEDKLTTTITIPDEVKSAPEMQFAKKRNLTVKSAQPTATAPGQAAKTTKAQQNSNFAF